MTEISPSPAQDLSFIEYFFALAPGESERRGPTFAHGCIDHEYNEPGNLGAVIEALLSQAADPISPKRLRTAKVSIFQYSRAIV